MKILTFDTSLDKTYVTFSEDKNIIADEIIENHNEKYHSAFLIPVIAQILKSNSISMKDIDVIGTNIGPGSFTGIRACVTVARVIAQQLNIPLVGVSSLEILSHINDTDELTTVVLDARKQQYYTAQYSNGKELKAPSLTNADDVLNFDFKNGRVIADEASGTFLKSAGIASEIYTEMNADLGRILNQIVCNKIQNCNKDDFLWGKLKPLYLQAPPVTISAKTKTASV